MNNAFYRGAAAMKALLPVVLSLLVFIIPPFSEMLPEATAFSIEQPKNGSIHSSNKPISVVLDLGATTGITKVSFYWYEEQEDMLKAFVEEKLAGVTTDPPFGANLRPPQAATGLYRLLAVAELENRQSDDEEWAVFDELLLHIQPHGSLEEIDFQTNKPLKFGRASAVRVYDQLDFLGKFIDLPVVGRFSDGATRSIRSAASGTTYHVDDESVITINKNGRLRLVGNGATTVTVNNSGVERKLDVLVEVNTEPNQPPVADPGPTRTVYSGETVLLNGLKSYDPEGGSLQYSWTQIRGSRIALLDPDSAKSRFFAPFVVEPRLFRFTLRVTDVQGADSVPAVIDIMVEP